MWKRKELKINAKCALNRNYWKAVLVSAIFAGVIGGAGFVGSTQTNSGDVLSELSICWIIFFAVVGVLAIAAAIVLGALLLNPLEVGVNKFLLNALEDKGAVSDLGYGFDVSYKRNVKTLFFRDLYTFLWFLLFIIPGFVKIYEYRMIPYLLAENPDMSKEEAFKTSKKMMQGNKWRSFKLDLSFILWYILGGLTLGILNIFYVNPYVQLTEAALYNALKTE